MSMEGYPDISLPRNVKHLLHVKSDPRTGTLVGMPASWICRLNPENSLSNNTELDIYKRSCKLTKTPTSNILQM
ncbi:hypothetical protein CHS0354_034925 [Potamilus streckersoni]|uniref:CRIB domain-containing protein n=1 Tax=Potamilus streckersoni TaxID=2493646 RepID=A0AAE0SD90_9BIVA|nr:hypothetical protein CHS0354_034925 [Potamilus streckersoni]